MFKSQWLSSIQYVARRRIVYYPTSKTLWANHLQATLLSNTDGHVRFTSILGIVYRDFWNEPSYKLFKPLWFAWLLIPWRIWQPLEHVSDICLRRIFMLFSLYTSSSWLETAFLASMLFLSLDCVWNQLWCSQMWFVLSVVISEGMLVLWELQCATNEVHDTLASSLPICSGLLIRGYEFVVGDKLQLNGWIILKTIKILCDAIMSLSLDFTQRIHENLSKGR